MNKNSPTPRWGVFCAHPPPPHGGVFCAHSPPPHGEGRGGHRHPHRRRHPVALGRAPVAAPVAAPPTAPAPAPAPAVALGRGGEGRAPPPPPPRRGHQEGTEGDEGTYTPPPTERGTAGAQTGRWTHPLLTPTERTALSLPRKNFSKNFLKTLDNYLELLYLDKCRHTHTRSRHDYH